MSTPFTDTTFMSTKAKGDKRRALKRWNAGTLERQSEHNQILLGPYIDRLPKLTSHLYFFTTASNPYEIFDRTIQPVRIMN